MGEKQGDREVMNGLVRDQVKSGVPAGKAQDNARKAMLEVDRKLREQGKR
jgi:hypothetical protein